MAFRLGAVHTGAAAAHAAQYTVHHGQGVGAALHHQVTARPLQNHAVAALAVLGGQRRCCEPAVVQQRQTGSIYAVWPAAGAVLGPAGHAQQPAQQVQVVNVHVVQRTAQTGRVKGGVPDALQVVIVPGAAGAEAGHRAAHLTDLGQLGLQKGVLRQVGDRDGLHQHQPLGVRQGKQLPRLGRCGGEGLFQQHMIPRLQRPLGRRIMQVVGRADVHGIEPARRVGCGLVGIHGRYAVLCRPGMGLLGALRPADDRRHLDLRPVSDLPHNLRHDPAGRQHCNL